MQTDCIARHSDMNAGVLLYGRAGWWRFDLRTVGRRNLSGPLALAGLSVRSFFAIAQSRVMPIRERSLLAVACFDSHRG